MKLEYKILTIEDEETWFNVTVKRPLSEYLSDKGFMPKIEREDGSNFSDTMADPSIDLILMDYNLAGGGNGANLINSIRELNVFTEVLFYSGKEDEMREEARKLRLEGVYFCNRTEVGKRAQDIINFAMDKVGQTNAMRALIMSEVANLDMTINSILKEGKPKLDAEKLSKFKDNIVGKIHEQQFENMEKIETWVKQDPTIIDEILDDRFFDSAKKAMALSSLAKAKGGVPKALKTTHTKYQSEVLKERNTLAHVCQGSDGCIRVGECVYDKDKFLTIRKSLIEHIKNIDKLRTALNS
ncbi:response regulator [uncultured Pseudodesulfovibrio sp.]|uniref:response regulator n=1 Tax=uncultured Pseudodesulfovibrio sp. TaxID=2035858 RepID=UPI0029C71FBE|nr:response regulator [uncultured Pseudodesulfovibrio sp.]